MMQMEISVATNFICSYLYNRLPRRRVDVLAEELEKGLRQRFLEQLGADSLGGIAQQILRFSEEKIDATFLVAVNLSGLNIEEIKEHLPKNLTLWIDPDEVSFRIGDTGTMTILYHNRPGAVGPQSFTTPVPSGQFPSSHAAAPSPNGAPNPFDQSFVQLALSLDRMGLGSSAAAAAAAVAAAATAEKICQSGAGRPGSLTLQQPNLLGRQMSAPANCFTAATFAQTKFGSTKLKNNSHQLLSNRPTNLTPSPIFSPNSPEAQFYGSLANIKPQMHPLYSPQVGPAISNWRSTPAGSPVLPQWRGTSPSDLPQAFQRGTVSKEEAEHLALMHQIQQQQNLQYQMQFLKATDSDQPHRRHDARQQTALHPPPSGFPSGQESPVDRQQSLKPDGDAKGGVVATPTTDGSLSEDDLDWNALFSTQSHIQRLLMAS